MFDKEQQLALKNSLIGLHVEDAAKWCNDRKIYWQIVRDGGNIQIITSTRHVIGSSVNFEVNEGIVTFIDFS